MNREELTKTFMMISNLKIFWSSWFIPNSSVLLEKKASQRLFALHGSIDQITLFSDN